MLYQEFKTSLASHSNVSFLKKSIPPRSLTITKSTGPFTEAWTLKRGVA